MWVNGFLVLQLVEAFAPNPALIAFVSSSAYYHSPSTQSSLCKFFQRASVTRWSTADIESDSSTEQGAPVEIWSQEKLLGFAESQGVDLSLSTLGPGYRCVARSSTNSSEIIGYIEGFVRPTGNLLHLDKMEVFAPVVQRVRRDNPSYSGAGTILGPGLLMGYLCLLHGLENDCIQAEFLAIDDENFQHRRLVRYYTSAGFCVIKYVGDDWQSIPDRLVWGGCGTLLRQDIRYLLEFWTRLLEKSIEKQQRRL